MAYKNSKALVSNVLFKSLFLDSIFCRLLLPPEKEHFCIIIETVLSRAKRIIFLFHHVYYAVFRCVKLVPNLSAWLVVKFRNEVTQRRK